MIILDDVTVFQAEIELIPQETLELWAEQFRKSHSLLLQYVKFYHTKQITVPVIKEAEPTPPLHLLKPYEVLDTMARSNDPRQKVKDKELWARLHRQQRLQKKAEDAARRQRDKKYHSHTPLPELD